MSGFDPVVVLPVYNHGAGAVRMVAAVRSLGLPCVMVDDGSAADCAARLDLLALGDDGVLLVRHAENQGKGAAVASGMRAALACGRTHVLQIDADGQHDTADIPRFLDLAKAHPQAVVCGTPLYDDSVPRARLYGRYLTHVWVWINTLSFAIRDSMCGFRVYPLARAIGTFDRANIGRRMDFDTEILVRLHWQGVRVINQPTRVVYPAGGVSHFDPWRDNLRISCMHARLFAGMLMRAPMLLWRKLRGAS